MMKEERGITLLEIVITVGIFALVVVSITQFFKASHDIWQANDRATEILENARIGMDKMVRGIREVKSFSSVSLPTDPNGSLEFINNDGETIKFHRFYDATTSQYCLGFNNSPLANPVDSLKFTCYMADYITETTDPNKIRSVKIELVVSDEEGVMEPITLSTRIFRRTD